MSVDRTPQSTGRQRRRRHVRERQAVIFGLLLALLAVGAVGSAAVYAGKLDLPFLPTGFSSPSPTGLAAADSPCPPEGTIPLAYTDVAVNVYNATKRVGLAGDTSNALSARGFVIASQGNASEQGYAAQYDGTAMIEFGPEGAAQAYTAAAQFDSPLLVLDNRQDTTVDVVVGSGFNALVASGDVVLTPGEPFASSGGCIPMDQVTAIPQPVPTPAAG